MRKFELQLIDVLRIQSYSGDFKHMSKFICKKIEKLGLTYTKDKMGNIYVTKGEGDVYPTMVCHIDTVHLFSPFYQVHQAGRNIFAVNKINCDKMGVGGDDKVGVFMTLKMLEDREVFKAAFFVDEEIGCVGSRACNFEFFNDSAFVLECDRKGSDDFVNSISGTKLYSREFSEALSPILHTYGRKEVTGGMTDVLEIAYKTKICVANMSCGYYNPHSDDEFVNIDDVFATYQMCHEIYDSLGFDLWRVTEDRNEYDYYSSYGGYGDYKKYGGGATYANTYGKRSQSYLPAKEDDFDFDEWNQSFGVKPERDLEFAGDTLECAYCGSLHTDFDLYDRDVYCHSCGGFMTENEYLNFIEELK